MPARPLYRRSAPKVVRKNVNSLAANGDLWVKEAERARAAVADVLNGLPAADNTPGAVEHMLRANGILRNLPWPAPFDRTHRRLHLGDTRDLSWIEEQSIHLVVTSPPYWTLKQYEHGEAQFGDLGDYEQIYEV